VIDPSARIHATADLEAGVSVGARTSIWHRAQLRLGAHVGADCVIGRDVFIDEGVILGDRVKVENAALVYHGVTVEDGAFIGPHAILTNDRHPRAVSSTGDLARAGDWQVAPINLREGCSIGAGAIVVAGTDVGRHAMVGAGAVVTRTVPDHALVAGNPARRLGWVCSCGRQLTDTASGQPAAADPAPDVELLCSSCGRHFVYVPDIETIREITRSEAESVRQGAPA
jgi:UDP-2-acetamido-3-amino-2,3-dideoxy-glucuronate N-acetyltransferase